MTQREFDMVFGAFIAGFILAVGIIAMVWRITTDPPPVTVVTTENVLVDVAPPARLDVRLDLSSMTAEAAIAYCDHAGGRLNLTTATCEGVDY